MFHVNTSNCEHKIYLKVHNKYLLLQFGATQVCKLLLSGFSQCYITTLINETTDTRANSKHNKVRTMLCRTMIWIGCSYPASLDSGAQAGLCWPLSISAGPPLLSEPLHQHKPSLLQERNVNTKDQNSIGTAG